MFAWYSRLVCVIYLNICLLKWAYPGLFLFIFKSFHYSQILTTSDKSDVGVLGDSAGRIHWAMAYAKPCRFCSQDSKESKEIKFKIGSGYWIFSPWGKSLIAALARTYLIRQRLRGRKRGKCLKIKRGIFARRRGRKLEMKKRSWVFRMPTTGADVIYKLQVTVTILC